MNEKASKQHNNDEVNRIIRRALKLKRAHGISYQELVDTAKEIGLDRQILEAAIEQERRELKMGIEIIKRMNRKQVHASPLLCE